MILCFAALAIAAQDATATYHSPDSQPLNDPMRPVTRIARDSFTLQYFTAKPCPSQVQVREGDLPAAAWGGPSGKPKATYTLSSGDKTPKLFHTLTVAGLKPGKRYFYRIYDPGATPTSQERDWGAEAPWRREYAVSTQSAKGSKTVIHLPVKVLLMPNVINVESAYAGAESAPLPPRMTAAEIEKIKSEFAVSSRFFWVNSGMRLWVDFQFFLDDRWQRWGAEPPVTADFYKGWPTSRSYAGQDYVGPGGGDFTVLDTKDPLRVTRDPVVEPFPYSGQVEMAWVRRWNRQTKKWEFYNSGGGTFGVDQFPRGFPGRSQFLGGGDTAWLATHEFHHDLESHGEYSLSNREDDRIVFNHYAPRKRTVKADGSADESAWTTSGRHGEHWDGMAFRDRTLTDAQWLRMVFGRTISVVDRDEDGFPDDDPRLPLDEKRFGSDAHKPATDGAMNDLRKAMLSTWVPGPLQPSWIKPPFQGIKPNPKSQDSDKDGLPDGIDPYPLNPEPPLIAPMRVDLDGDATEWSGLPYAATFDKGGIRFAFKQSHDESAYYGLFEIKGPWKRIDATFDGEGLGVYSGVGVLGFQLVKNDVPPGSPGPRPTPFEVRPAFGGAPGLKYEIRETADSTIVEFKLPNRGPSPWFWTRGGREIGVVLNVWDRENRGYCAWEPYRPFYARMVEPHGKEPLPTKVPAEPSGTGVQVFLPGDAKVKLGAGWTVKDGAWRHSGGESPLSLSGLAAKEFDLFAIVEAKNDGILGAFTKSNQMNAGEGYIGFVGGYGNLVTKMRVFGEERGDEPVTMTPGPHRLQLTRRGGELWLLVDGKAVIYTSDPSPQAVVDRLAVLGGFGGEQIVKEIRLRL